MLYFLVLNTVWTSKELPGREDGYTLGPGRGGGGGRGVVPPPSGEGGRRRYQ